MGISHRNRINLQETKCGFLSGFLALICLAACSCTSLGIEKPPVEPTVSGIAPLEHNVREVVGGPYLHQILSACSPDGLNWTNDDGVRLDHASVPCAISDGNRIILYYVDADRAPGQPESISCATSTDGINFLKQPFKIDGLATRKALDPSILRDTSGQYLLYYLASNATGDPAAETGDHQIHLAVSKDGINFSYDRAVFSYPDLVDPDVFVFNGKWFMYVFSKNQTIIATSDDGRNFTYQQPLDLGGWGTVAPIQLDDGKLRLYAFQQGKVTGNLVRSFVSTDGLKWQEEPGDRLTASNNNQITDPFVIHWKNGYKMFFKVEKRTGQGSQSQQSLPAAGAAGPWDNDVLVFRINPDGTVAKTTTFERAGVPTIARMKDGRLIAAYQFFPANDADNFDKVAVCFSSDEGDSWTNPQVIRLAGLPDGMRFPFDPTLLILPDGKIRLYFTSLYGKQFKEDTPAIYSAISTNGIDYTFEARTRFYVQGRYIIDCAVVLHQGIFHLYAPDNGIQPVLSPNTGIGYHAVSSDGLNFTRVDDVSIEGDKRWLGSAQSDGKVITFWGTSQKSQQPNEFDTQQKGGLWLASSTDGKSWELLEAAPISGADPGAVASQKGGWIVVATCPPRPDTPSAQRSQSKLIPQGSSQSLPTLNPLAPGSDGPWNHRVMLATSADGVAWTVSDELMVEQASVPELFLSPEGLPILVFVDASGKTNTGKLGVMSKQWMVLG